jgi:hypothetical protein
MSFNDFMNRVRQWDNRHQQGIIRHFYILFFEAILVAIFVGVFINTLKIIDINVDIHKGDLVERLLLTQSINTLLIVILLLFNSFWTLYIFSSLLRLRSVLKNIDFNLSRSRSGPQR